MPQCPQCSKPLVELTRQCPSCRADLDLLVEYVNGLQGSLCRAEQFTRAGELGQAVWAYLEVLEVDPDNPVARRQVGQVATAVRQFDYTAPGRRWAQGLPLNLPVARPMLSVWAQVTLAVVAVLIAFGLGFISAQGPSENSSQPADSGKQLPLPRNEHQLGK